MSIDDTKKSVFPDFADRFNKLIGYQKREDRKRDPVRSQVAKSLGVPYETVRTWSEGNNLPAGKQLLKIRDIYPETNIDYLLFGEEAHKNISEVVLRYPYEDRELHDMLEQVLTGDIGGKSKIISALQEAINVNKRDKDVLEIKDLLRQLLESIGVSRKTKKGRAPGNPERGESKSA